MSDPGTLQLLATGLNFVPALLWTVVAADLWCFLRKRQSRGAVFLILFVLGCLVAVHFSLWTLWMMIPLHLGTPSTFRGLLLALIDATVVAVLSVGRHFALIWPVRARPPRRRGSASTTARPSSPSRRSCSPTCGWSTCRRPSTRSW